MTTRSARGTTRCRRRPWHRRASAAVLDYRRRPAAAAAVRLPPADPRRLRPRHARSARRAGPRAGRHARPARHRSRPRSGRPSAARRRSLCEQPGCEVFVFDDVEENPTTDARRGRRRVRSRSARSTSSSPSAAAARWTAPRGSTSCSPTAARWPTTRASARRPSRCCRRSACRPRPAPAARRSRYALIADEKTHLKMACGDRKAAFRVAILDPEVTVSQPRKRHRRHRHRRPRPRRRIVRLHQAQSAVADVLARGLAAAGAEPRDGAARARRTWKPAAAMQLGAIFAGTAIENSMLGVCHACANPLTAHYGITHGTGDRHPAAARHSLQRPGGRPLYADLVARRRPAQRRAARRRCWPSASTDLIDAAELADAARATAASATRILPLLAEEANEQWTARFNPRPVTEADLHARLSGGVVSVPFGIFAAIAKAIPTSTTRQHAEPQADQVPFGERRLALPPRCSHPDQIVRLAAPRLCSKSASRWRPSPPPAPGAR